MFSKRTFSFLGIIVIVIVGLVNSLTLQTSKRISGGYAIDIAKAPYAIQFRDRYGSYICGGTLIAPKFVVSAAHCFDDDDTDVDEIVAVGGATRLLEEGEERDVVKITKHPEYKSSEYYNDIAVVELENNMEGLNIKPIPLCKKSLNTGDFLQVSGWGQLTEDGDNSEYLRTVRLPVAAKEKCLKEFGKLSMTNMFCASGDEPKSFCMGDSGGPAVYMQQLCGVVSYLNDCGKIGSHSVFSDVYALRSFVNKVMGV